MFPCKSTSVISEKGLNVDFGCGYRHLYYTLPPAVLLHFLLSPVRSRRDIFKITLLSVIAVISTTPWDSYLILTKVCGDVFHHLLSCEPPIARSGPTHLAAYSAPYSPSRLRNISSLSFRHISLPRYTYSWPSQSFIQYFLTLGEMNLVHTLIFRFLPYLPV